MAARPPPSNGDPEESTAFGIVAIDDHLDDADLSFPATGAEVVDALDDPSVPCGPNGHDVALSTVLDHTDARRFDSRQELLDELHDGFERERRGNSGIVAWLRSLFSG